MSIGDKKKKKSTRSLRETPGSGLEKINFVPERNTGQKELNIVRGLAINPRNFPHN